MLNFGTPSALKACTTLEFWSPTNTVPPPGVVATACGKRKTPPPWAGSPTTDPVSAGAACAGATAPPPAATTAAVTAADSRARAGRRITDHNVTARPEVAPRAMAPGALVRP